MRTARDLPAEDDLLASLANLEDELDSPELTAASAPAGSQLIERGGHAGMKLTRHLGPEAQADVERTPAVAAAADGAQARRAPQA